MSGPTTDNKVANFFNELIAAMMKGGVQAAEVYVISVAPIFATPILKSILSWALGYVGTFLSVAGQKFADQVIIDIQTNREESNVMNAATELAIALDSGNQAAIDKAVGDASEAYRRAFNFDGWGTPVK